MVRTKHAFLFVVSFFVLTLIVLDQFVSHRESSASVANTENPAVTEPVELTVREQTPKDTAGIRTAVLAKLRAREESASVILSASEMKEEAGEESMVSEPEATEEALPTEEKFDWALWLARIPEFEEKQMQYGVNVQNVKDSVEQITLKKNELSVKLVGNTASTAPETLAELTNQNACFENLMVEGQNLITMLEGSDAAPLGLLYTVLMKDIRAQYAQDAVEELYAQSVATEARNATLTSDFGAKSMSCDGPVD